MEHHRPRRKWGQNFLRSQAAVEKIAAAVEPEPEELIVEIGPGEGVLTKQLLEHPNDLLAIEIDPSLAARLKRELGASHHLEVVNEDALEVELPARPYVAVGNLPYNVANPIIRRIISSEHWRRAVFMVQKEVADRILATPDDEAFGFFSVLIRVHADPSRVMTLEPSAFWPRPKVRSSVVKLDRVVRKFATSAESIVDLASAGFRMRRKKLRNSLEGYRGLTRDEWSEVAAAAEIGEEARAEELTIGDYDRLAAVIERRERDHSGERSQTSGPP